jgi:hypothetical protein
MKKRCDKRRKEKRKRLENCMGKKIKCREDIQVQRKSCAKRKK